MSDRATRLGHQQASTNGGAATWAVPAGHNRVEVVVEPDTGLTAGDLLIYRHEPHPSAARLRGLAASAPFDTRGAAVVVEVPPNGSMLTAEVAAIQGSGSVRCTATSWRQG